MTAGDPLPAVIDTQPPAANEMGPAPVVFSAIPPPDVSITAPPLYSDTKLEPVSRRMTPAASTTTLDVAVMDANPADEIDSADAADVVATAIPAPMAVTTVLLRSAMPALPVARRDTVPAPGRYMPAAAVASRMRTTPLATAPTPD